MQSVAVKAEVKYAAPALLSAYHLEAEGITKRYPGVVALDGISLKKVRPGTVHALMGENGAGKSTLMKIIAGIARPDAGEIRVGGWPVHFHSPRDATDAGIAMIHQELNLVPHMTIAENIWMGREPTRFGLVNHGELNRRTRMLFTRLGIDLDPEQPLGSLTVASQQLVEIAKAVSYDSDVLITYAIGGNVLAARVSGINVGRHLVLVYTIAGLLSGLGGTITAARAQSGQAGMGLSYELDAIAAAAPASPAVSARSAVPS
jgi:ABC-type lipoprotein export system ATPase subunit